MKPISTEKQNNFKKGFVDRVDPAKGEVEDILIGDGVQEWKGQASAQRQMDEDQEDCVIHRKKHRDEPKD